MGARDPETGQFVSGDGGDMAEYADHEVQQIYASVTVDADAPNTSENDVVLQYEPVSDRGIDSDELAELVGFKRSASLYLGGVQDNTQTQIGAARGELGMGINLTETEFAEQRGDAADAPGVVVDTDLENLGQSEKNTNDDPGVLDSIPQYTMTPGAAPTTDQNISVGSAGQVHEREVNLRSMLGTGPFVDKTDDITVHIEAGKSNFNGDTFHEAVYNLYWRVHEVPEGRASFARP